MAGPHPRGSLTYTSEEQVPHHQVQGVTEERRKEPLQVDKAARDICVDTLVIRRWQGFGEVCGGFCISSPQSAA